MSLNVSHLRPALGSVLPFIEKGREEASNITKKRLEDLDQIINEAKREMGEYSLLHKQTTEFNPIQTLLLEDNSAFVQIHCGRTAYETNFEEKYDGSGITLPVQKYSVAMLNAIFNWINCVEFSFIGKNGLKHIQSEIHQLLQTVQKQESLFKKDQLSSSIHEIVAEIAKTLDELQKGQGYTIAVGQPGCGMFLRFVRTEKEEKSFNLFLYNASEDSVQNQGGITKGVDESVRPLYVYENVPGASLYYQKGKQLAFPLLVEVMTFTFRKVEFAKFYDMIAFFGPIQNYQVKSEPFMKDLLRAERSKMGSRKALKALVLHLCDGDRKSYKRLSIDIRLATAIAQYKICEDELSHPKYGALRNELRQAAYNLLKYVYKYGSTDIVNENELKHLAATAFEIIGAVDLAEEKARELQADKRSTEIRSPQDTQVNEKARKAIFALKDSEIDNRVSHSISPYQKGKLATTSPEQICKGLESLKDSIKHYILEGITLGSDSKFKILDYRGFAVIEDFIAQLPSPLNDFWDKIPQEQVLECLQHLSAINEKYGESIALKKNSGVDRSAHHPRNDRQQVTLLNFYGNIDRLARRADRDFGLLSEFHINIDCFKNAVHNDPFHTIHNYTFLKRRNELLDYFNPKSAASKCIFTWNDFGIDPKDSDLDLCKKMASHPILRDKINEKVVQEFILKCFSADPLAAVRGVYEAGSRYLHSLFHLDIGKDINVTYGSKLDIVRGEFPSFIATTFPHILALKQASIGVAVLMRPASKDAINISVSINLSGDLLEQKKHAYDQLNAFRKIDVVQQPPDNDFEIKLIYYTRILEKVKSTSKERYGSERYSNSHQFAVRDSESTNMYELNSGYYRDQNRTKCLAASNLGQYDKKTEGWDVAELVTNPSIGIYNLLQWMRLHPEKIEDREINERVYLNILLFRPSYGAKNTLIVPIIEELKTHPELILPQIRHFISEGITRFYLAQPNKRPKATPLVFLLDLAQQIERNYEEIYGHPMKPPLYETDLINRLLSLEDGDEPYKTDENSALHLSAFTHFFPCTDPSNLSNEQMITAACAWIEINTAGVTFKATEFGERQVELSKRGSIQFIEEFIRRKNDKQFTDSFVFAISKKYGLPSLKIEISSYLSPSLQGSNEIGKWILDLGKGLIFCNGHLMGIASPPSVSGYRIWSHLMEKRKHSYYKLNNCTFFRDPIYGNMSFGRSRSGDKLLKRQIDSTWYSFVPPDTDQLDLLVPKLLRSGYSHWITQKPELDEPTLLICDLKTGRPRYIQKYDGCLEAVTSTKDWSCSFKNIRTCINSLIFRKPTENIFDRLLSPGAYIVYHSENDKQASKVEFPQLKTASGDSVIFRQEKNGTWIYQPDPSFEVESPQLDQLFAHHNQYLVLKKRESTERKLLMVQPPKIQDIKSSAYSPKIKLEIDAENPWSKNTRLAIVREFRQINGKIIAESVEDKLFLSCQLLAGKDYVGAMAMLRQLGAGDTLTAESRVLVEGILKSESSFNDYSPEACSIRLKVLSLAMTIDLTYKVNSVVSEKPKRAFKDIFKGYLKGFVRLPQELVLSDRELISLDESYGFQLSSQDQIEWSADFDESKEPYITPWDKDPTLYRPRFFSEKSKPKIYDPQIRINLMLDGFENKSPALPIFGDEEVTVEQFYHLYEELTRSTISESEKKAIAYYLQHFNHHEKTFDNGATSARLQILKCVYIRPKDAPLLPVEKNCLIGWKTWIDEFEIKYSDATYRESIGIISDGSRDFRLSQINKGNVKSNQSPAVSTATPIKIETLPKISVDLSLIAFSQDYFEEFYQEPEEALEPLKLPAQLSENDLPYRDAIESEFEFYENDIAIARQQSAKKVKYRLSEGKTEIQLTEEIKAYIKATDGLKAQLEKQEGLILFLINLRQISSVGIWAKQESPVIKDASLIEVIRACRKGTFEAYRALNPYLKHEDVKEIHQRTVEFMLDFTTYQQLMAVGSELEEWEKANDVEAKAHWDKAVEILTTRRKYAHATPEEIQDSIKNNLFFEFITSFRIRSKPLALISETLNRLHSSNEKERHFLYQLIMGGGKTSYFVSKMQDILSELDELGYVVLDPTQFDAIIGNLKKYQKERYEKELISIDYSREQLNLSTLKQIHKTICDARKDRNGIAIKSTFPQILLLELRDIACHLRDGGSLDLDRASLIAKILLEKPIFKIDEVQLVLNIIKQLNFPKGEPSHLSLERIELISEIFLALEEENLMKFGEGCKPITKEEYHTRLKEKITEISARKRKIPQQHIQAYKRYVTNQIQPEIELLVRAEQALKPEATIQEQEDYAYLYYLNWELSRSEAGLQALSRFLIPTLLPQVLSQEPDRHFGFDKENPIGKVSPFSGRKNPLKTEIANPYEEACVMFYCALYLGIQNGFIEHLAQHMHKAAEGHMLHKGGYENTPEAIKFFEITGVPLSKASKGRELDTARENLNLAQNRHKRIEFLSMLVHTIIKYYCRFLTAEAYDIPHLSKGNVVFSGTPGILENYERVNYEPKLDAGTVGGIFEILRRQGKGKLATVLPANKTTTQGLLDLIEERDKEVDTPRLSAIMDASGIIQDSTGRQFALAYLNHFKNNANRNSVIFFHRYILTEQKKLENSEIEITRKTMGTFAALRKRLVDGHWMIDNDIIFLKDTTPECVKNAGIMLDTTFVLYEESKISGVDFKLPHRCRGFGTTNPFNLTADVLAQEATRLRNLGDGQDFEHIIPEQFLDFYGPDLETPTVDQILETSIVNQARSKAIKVTRGFQERMRFASRNGVQQELLRVAASRDTTAFIEFVKIYGDYLDTQYVDDLFGQFGSIAVTTDSLSYLKQLEEDELARLPEGQIKESVMLALRMVYIEAEAASKKGYLASQMSAPSRLPALGTQVQIIAERTQEAQKQSQRQVEIELELKNELLNYKGKENYGSISEKKWEDLEKLNGSLPGQKQGVVTFSIHEYMKSNENLYPKERRYHEAFSKSLRKCPLLFSENFVYTAEEANLPKPLSIFHLAHKTISHILLAQGHKGKIAALALSNNDFALWRKQIQDWEKTRVSVPYWIINLNGEISAGKGELSKDSPNYELPNNLGTDPRVQNVLLYANFFNGNLDYLEGHPEQTLSFMRERCEARYQFLKTRCGIDIGKRIRLQSNECFRPTSESLDYVSDEEENIFSAEPDPDPILLEILMPSPRPHPTLSEEKVEVKSLKHIPTHTEIQELNLEKGEELPISTHIEIQKLDLEKREDLLPEIEPEISVEKAIDLDQEEKALLLFDENQPLEFREKFIPAINKYAVDLLNKRLLHGFHLSFLSKEAWVNSDMTFENFIFQLPSQLISSCTPAQILLLRERVLGEGVVKELKIEQIKQMRNKEDISYISDEQLEGLSENEINDIFQANQSEHAREVNWKKMTILPAFIGNFCFNFSKLVGHFILALFSKTARMSLGSAIKETFNNAPRRIFSRIYLSPDYGRYRKAQVDNKKRK